jgi:hypothetical protein
MASSSTRNLIEGSYLTRFLMLGGEIMEAMTLASASTYKNNMKFQDKLSCKSSVEKKNKTHGSRQWKPFTRIQKVTIRKNRKEFTTTNPETKQKGRLTHNPSSV